MNKRLKISIKQFDAINDRRTCKVTIALNGKVINGVIIVSLIGVEYESMCILDFLIKNKLEYEFNYVYKRALYQINNDSKYGVDTYWKWDNKDNE